MPAIRRRWPMRRRLRGRCVAACVAAWLVAVTATALAASAGVDADAALQAEADRWVEQAFEEPARSLEALRALERRVHANPGQRRLVLVALGLAAADNNLVADAQEAIDALESLVPGLGPLAHADALLVRADLESAIPLPVESHRDAQAAVEAYRPFCESPDHQPREGCSPYDWFWANMFAGTIGRDQGEPATSALYLQEAAEIALHARQPALSARALAVLATVAQEEGNAVLADRQSARARQLADESGEAIVVVFARSYASDMHVARQDLAGARRLLEEAEAIAVQGGLRRRAAECAAGIADLDLRQGRPQHALEAIGRARPVMQSFNVETYRDWLDADEVIALLQLGRLPAARAMLPALLDRMDHRAGFAERSERIRQLGAALAQAGDVDGALALFEREQQTLFARGDKVFEKQMLALQEDLRARQHAERLATIELWGGVAGAATLLLLVAGAVSRWLQLRNQRLARANETLRAQAEHDALTTLGNREYLTRRLREAGLLQVFTGVLFLLDIDHFKAVNDRLGHPGGDAVLRDVAHRLQSAMRDGDLVIRWGGEEFVVAVLSGPRDVDALVDRVMHVLSATPVVVDGRAVDLAASIGYASFPLPRPEGGIGFEQALAVIDAAMYEAKRGGRNAAVRVDDLDPALLADPSGLPDALPSAIAAGRARLTRRPGPARDAA